MQGIGVIRKLCDVFLLNSLLIIYEVVVRPHLMYHDITYDEPNSVGVITGAIMGTSEL